MRAVQNADASFLSITNGLKKLIDNSPKALFSIVEILEGVSCAEVSCLDCYLFVSWLMLPFHYPYMPVFIDIYAYMEIQ